MMMHTKFALLWSCRSSAKRTISYLTPLFLTGHYIKVPEIDVQTLVQASGYTINIPAGFWFQSHWPLWVDGQEFSQLCYPPNMVEALWILIPWTTTTRLASRDSKADGSFIKWWFSVLQYVQNFKTYFDLFVEYLFFFY